MSGYVELEVSGKLYITEYHVTNGVLTVYGNASSKDDTLSEFTTVNSHDDHGSTAKVLLRRLIKRGQIEPELE